MRIPYPYALITYAVVVMIVLNPTTYAISAHHH